MEPESVKGFQSGPKRSGKISKFLEKRQNNFSIPDQVSFSFTIFLGS